MFQIRVISTTTNKIIFERYSATSVIRTTIFRNLDHPVLKSQKLLKVKVQLQLYASANATCSIVHGYYNNYTIASGLIQLVIWYPSKIFGQRGADNGGCTVSTLSVVYVSRNGRGALYKPLKLLTLKTRKMHLNRPFKVLHSLHLLTDKPYMK